VKAHQVAVNYAEFGEAFVLTAVNPARVVEAVKRIAGDRVDLGPLRAGPANAATVTATGLIGDPDAEELPAEGTLRYSVRLPVELTLDVRVGARGRFHAIGEIELRLEVRTKPPLAIDIDVEPVSPKDARFRVEAHGVQSRVLQRAGDIESELSRHAAAYVNERVTDPQARRYTHIDLAPLIDRVWEAL
jgi:hypothetical protein